MDEIHKRLNDIGEALQEQDTGDAVDLHDRLIDLTETVSLLADEVATIYRKIRTLM